MINSGKQNLKCTIERLIMNSLEEASNLNSYVLPELPVWVPARDSLYLRIASSNEA